MLSRERALDAILELAAGSEGVSRADLLARVLRTTLPLVQASGAVLVTPCQGRLERRVARLESGETETTGEAARSDSELARLVLHSGRPLRVPDLVADGRADGGDACPGVDAGPAVFVPLRRRERGAGMLAAYRDRGAAAFSPSDVRQLALLAAWAAMALENLRLSESVEKLAVTDDLTQVYNYRFLKLALRRELKRAARFGQDLALVMLDVDHLKAYNDRHGHLRGSYLLREIASLLARQVRSFDLIAKYGGDEFTLILPQTGIEGAMTVAERMRRAVAEHAFPLEAAGAISISAGVAAFPRDAEDGPSLIRAADQALYAAKNQGRNQVLTYHEVLERAGSTR